MSKPFAITTAIKLKYACKHACMCACMYVKKEKNKCKVAC